MAVTLSESAAERVRSHLSAKPDKKGLRLGVRKTGCSGYSYVVELTEEIGPQDTVFESQGLSIVVDEDSLALVDGTEIEFKKDGLSESFQFRNPREAATCGCGESFSV